MLNTMLVLCIGATITLLILPQLKTVDGYYVLAPDRLFKRFPQVDNVDLEQLTAAFDHIQRPRFGRSVRWEDDTVNNGKELKSS